MQGILKTPISDRGVFGSRYEAKEVRNRLFDPFFTTKAVGKRTEMGLSIRYQIVVERHKGSLHCFSELGQGCEFWIELPITQNISEESKPSNGEDSFEPIRDFDP